MTPEMGTSAFDAPGTAERFGMIAIVCRAEERWAQHEVTGSAGCSHSRCVIGQDTAARTRRYRRRALIAQNTKTATRKSPARRTNGTRTGKA